MELLQEIVERCKNAIGENLVSVVLFGSTARGLQDERSDIDLLIVVEEEVEGDPLKDVRMEFLLNHSVKLDTIVLSKKDVVGNFDYFSPLFVSFVLGITILVDDGFFREKYFEFLNKVKEENILYVEGGKTWDLKKISSERILKEKYTFETTGESDQPKPEMNSREVRT